MKINQTLKTAIIVYLLTFIPLLILIIISSEDLILDRIIYSFVLFAGFIGAPIYLLTLLNEIVNPLSNLRRFLTYLLVTNTLIILIGIAIIYSFTENLINAIGSYFTTEYLIINLGVTILLIIIPLIRKRLA